MIKKYALRPLSTVELQLIVVLTSLGAFALLQWLMNHSRFGLEYRACSQDSRMAALCGVNVSQTVTLGFIVGNVYAALSGYVIALYYGVVNFYMGFSMGLKALTAVVVGGIGSIPGALLGSLLIGFAETYWSAYLSFEYRDVAVFALLIGFLVLRPQGLLGKSTAGIRRV